MALDSGYWNQCLYWQSVIIIRQISIRIIVIIWSSIIWNIIGVVAVLYIQEILPLCLPFQAMNNEGTRKDIKIGGLIYLFNANSRVNTYVNKTFAAWMAKYMPIPIRDIPEMIEMPIRIGLDKKRLKVLAMMAIAKSQIKRPIRIPELYKSK